MLDRKEAARVIGVSVWVLDRYIADPLRLDGDGKATASERPGHGIVFDWKGLEALRA